MGPALEHMNLPPQLAAAPADAVEDGAPAGAPVQAPPQPVTIWEEDAGGVRTSVLTMPSTGFFDEQWRQYREACPAAGVPPPTTTHLHHAQRFTRHSIETARQSGTPLPTTRLFVFDSQPGARGDGDGSVRPSRATRLRIVGLLFPGLAQAGADGQALPLSTIEGLRVLDVQDPAPP